MQKQTTRKAQCEGTGSTEGTRISQWTGYLNCPVCGKAVAPNDKTGALKWHVGRTK